jgi:hypothetical protein
MSFACIRRTRCRTFAAHPCECRLPVGRTPRRKKNLCGSMDLTLVDNDYGHSSPHQEGTCMERGRSGDQAPPSTVRDAPDPGRGRGGADIAIKLSLDRMAIGGRPRAATGRRRFPGHASRLRRATDPVGAAGLISPATPEISFDASPSAHGVSVNKKDQSTRSSIVRLPPTAVSSPRIDRACPAQGRCSTPTWISWNSGAKLAMFVEPASPSTGQKS